MIKEHHLKTESPYYEDVRDGKKTFELRKNDRDFKKGDTLILHHVINGERTGRSLFPIEIRYILKGGKYGLDPEYCILSW